MKIKRSVVLLLVGIMMLMLVGCGCDHEWKEATCTSLKTCANCGETEGDIKEHNWKEATCTSTRTCEDCGETEGEPLGHDYTEATVESPKSCKRCGETSGEKIKLSETCDKVLAQGVESNGDIYELVANETETYEGAVVTVGVIKNNKWLVEMSSNMPLIDSDKTLYGSDVSGLDSAPSTIYYIGKGCFWYRNIYEWGWSGKTYQEIVYNAENGKYHELVELDKSTSNHPSHIGYDDSVGTKANVTNDNYVIWQFINWDRNGVEVTFLDITTMQTKKTMLGNCGLEPICYPFSEGLFAVTNYHGDFKFYDINGNMVLDLSSYDLTGRKQPLFFKDGKCTFSIVNNNNNIYTITIDKSGKVIESKQTN